LDAQLRIKVKVSALK